MNLIIEMITQALFKVWISFTHNWPFLLASILISVALKLYVNPHKVSAWITRYRRVGIAGATVAAVTTPFCSCGTTAVILGMVASTMPWSPIVAFMVASPLTSPQELVYSAGLFGWPFAIMFFVSSILLGLVGGLLAEFFETRGWLANQARFQTQTTKSYPTAAIKPQVQVAALPASACEPSENSGGKRDVGIRAGTIDGFRDIRANRPVLLAGPNLVAATADATVCCLPAVDPAPGIFSPAISELPQAFTPADDCGCASTKEDDAPAPGNTVTIRHWLDETIRTGKQLLPMFLGFAFIGYLLNGLIPQEWVAAVFGGGSIYSVPLAATLGLPLYINTEGSLPLVRALIDSGMSQGAALAFLITGAGTSVGAIAGALTIARWRVIALVIGTLWAGSILLGYAYNLLLAAQLF